MENKEYVTLKITDLSEDGEGIGRHEGMAVFVAGAMPGETVEAEIHTFKKNYAKGISKNIVNPTDDRILPLCTVADICGGCQIQQLKYEAQLLWKENHVKSCLKRLGGFENLVVNPIIGMDNPWNYRNKMLYPIGGTVENPQIGFYIQNTNQVVPVEKCWVHSPENDLVLGLVRKLMIQHNIEPSSARGHRGALKYVMIRNNIHGKMMVVLVTAGAPMPHEKKLAKELKSAFGNIETLLINYNPHKDHRILGKETHILFGNGTLEDQIGDLGFEISPHSFYQVNPSQTEVLYEKTLEYANLKGHETVLDLYCGIGTISLFAARKASKVIGIEAVETAIKDARKNAEHNNINNAEFICGYAENVLPTLVEQGIKPEVAIVDPPRKGCDGTALNAIIELGPERIIYVSCKPATLARDLKILTSKEYEIIEIQPVDQFPHTVHVECVAVLKKKED